MKLTKIKNIIKNQKNKKKQNEIINKNESQSLIQPYLNAIDYKNITVIKQLTIKGDENKIENDIVYEIYSNNQLSKERLLFIIENCTSYLNISSRLIAKLMKDNNTSLLEPIFERHLKFYDNEMIIKLLSYYKNGIPISNSYLYKQLNNDKYKISIDLNQFNYDRLNHVFDSSYYLFNPCLTGLNLWLNI